MESRMTRFKNKYGLSNSDTKLLKPELNTENPHNPFLNGIKKLVKPTLDQTNKENVDAINHPKRKMSRKKKTTKEKDPFEVTTEDDEIPNQHDDKKNLRRQLGTTRNIHFQLISADL